MGALIRNRKKVGMSCEEAAGPLSISISTVLYSCFEACLVAVVKKLFCLAFL